LQSPAQVEVPIYSLDEEWEWAEAFCDPNKKDKARMIDFQDMKRETKKDIAKRVCPDFETTFNALINML